MRDIPQWLTKVILLRDWTPEYIVLYPEMIIISLRTDWFSFTVSSVIFEICWLYTSDHESSSDHDNTSVLSLLANLFTGVLGLCKLRCFPPVALAWDSTSGLHIFPNLFSETVVVDSSPAIWSAIQGSEKTTVLLLVWSHLTFYFCNYRWFHYFILSLPTKDFCFCILLQLDPHCSYRTSVVVSVTAAAGRFLLVYYSQVISFNSSNLDPVLTYLSSSLYTDVFMYLTIVLGQHALKNP